MAHEGLRFYTRVVDGPGELDLMLNVLRRQVTVRFKLDGDNPQTNRGWFKCRISSLRVLGSEERISTCGCDFELMVDVQDHVYPELVGLRILYSTQTREGQISELLIREGSEVQRVCPTPPTPNGG